MDQLLRLEVVISGRRNKKMSMVNGYKAFNKGLICKDKQYAENAEFVEEEVEMCSKGMHYCENPFDVLNYYSLVDDYGEITEFAEVEGEDPVYDKEKKKCATKRLKVGAKLSLKGFIEACFNFIWEKAEEKTGKDKDVIASYEYGAQLASSGYGAQIASSGDYARLASSGDSAQIASSGDSAQIASSGYGAQIASSGDGAQLASSGYGAQLASSGDYARLASSGDSAQIASSGYGAQIASSGDSAQIASSGDYARLASSGDGAIVAAIGINSKAKAKKGSWITLAEYKQENGYLTPVCVRTEQVDGERIREEVFYQLKGGEFVEVEA